MRLIFLFALLLATAAGDELQAPVQHTNIVLVGATGNLAEKYLWQAFLQLYASKGPQDTMAFWGGSRADPASGTAALDAILERSLKCPKKELGEDECRSLIAEFRQQVTYTRLKERGDFALLAQKIEARHSPDRLETGRLFYLSMPPSAYAGTARMIDEIARPKNQDAWLRVAVEKPFGSDYNSAQDMAGDLAEFLTEEEIYRVDHYLGKRGVQQILAFRRHNQEQLDKLFSSEHVERVDIVMTEEEDCRGRTKFYDEYGVVRDVLQNHLTEILALVAMEDVQEPLTTEKIIKNKLRILQFTAPAELDGKTIVGQYADYPSHVQQDFQDTAKVTKTPTFAAAALKLELTRWHNVPFVLAAGKQLAERRAYVRLVFKQDHSAVCIGQPNCGQREIRFHIQGGGVEPSVLLLGNFPGLSAPPSWRSVGSPNSGFVQYIPDDSVGAADAYSALIAQMHAAQRENFVSTPALMASWRIWTPLLDAMAKHPERLITYGPGGKEVQFRLEESGFLSLVSQSSKTAHRKRRQHDEM